MPDLTAASEYKPPSARSINVSLRATCVVERCTIVTCAPCSQRSAQMSCAELFDPTTSAFLAFHSSPFQNLLECTCVPLKLAMPGYSGRLGTALIPVANTRCFGRSTTFSPLRLTVTSHSCSASRKRAPLHSVPDQ